MLLTGVTWLPWLNLRPFLAGCAVPIWGASAHARLAQIVYFLDYFEALGWRPNSHHIWTEHA